MYSYMIIIVLWLTDGRAEMWTENKIDREKQRDIHFFSLLLRVLHNFNNFAVNIFVFVLFTSRILYMLSLGLYIYIYKVPNLQGKKICKYTKLHSG